MANKYGLALDSGEFVPAEELNTTQPEALRLAGFLDKLDVRTVDRIQNCLSAAAELRRLHAYAAELESQVIADCMAGGAGGVSPLMGAAGDAGWRDISTAPKDGRTVLVYPATWDDRSCSTAKYNPDKYAKKPKPYWYRDDAFGKVGICRGRPPTHWRELPPAPSSDKGVAHG